MLEVFAVTRDRAWLVSTLPALRKQYAYWAGEPHHAGTTGLSRYHALGEGPAPEVVTGGRDARGRTYYDRVRAALADEPMSTPSLAHVLIRLEIDYANAEAAAVDQGNSVSDDDHSFPRPLVGLVRVREHCTFTWRKATPGAPASVEVREDHCPQCLADVRRRGYRLLSPDGQDYPG